MGGPGSGPRPGKGGSGSKKGTNYTWQKLVRTTPSRKGGYLTASRKANTADFAKLGKKKFSNVKYKKLAK